MDLYHIINKELQLTVCSKGAEIQSIMDISTKQEYLWDGDPEYWARRSPILFPFVGRLKNNSYRYHGTVYSMPQHGFARDMDFERLYHSEDAIWFRLTSNDKTYRIYPFHFTLRTGYQLLERKVLVQFEVENQDGKPMYFSIGAHPAFLCPAYEKEKQAGCYLKLDTNGPLLRNQLDPETGYVQKYDIAVSLKNGLLPVKPELFAQDALIIEGGQAHRVSLLDSQKNPVVSVTFQAPLFGIWAPRRQDVPFVCIEPWYGRCDSEDFSGTMEERPYTNTLEPGAVFRAGYEMEFYQEGAKI